MVCILLCLLFCSGGVGGFGRFLRLPSLWGRGEVFGLGTWLGVCCGTLLLFYFLLLSLLLFEEGEAVEWISLLG